MIKKKQHDYTEEDFRFELWVDDQIDQLREYEMQDKWEEGDE
jgi:hypothetical protein